jgi:hypothetical protein
LEIRLNASLLQGYFLYWHEVESMNGQQLQRTAGFVAVAVLAVLVAWLTQPRMPGPEAESMVGKELFENFKDPLAAASLEIVKYDESKAELQPFKVALVNNRWCIPSHENYPADAKDQLADAAASLIGLTVLEEVTDNPGDHALYGVVDPDPETLEAGATGVGMRVIMRNAEGEELLNLIIGKEVPGREGLRYVRRRKEPQVYVVALRTDKLSTKFEDWIERDLLQLNTWDIRQVTIQDYSVDIVQGIQIPRSYMVVEYDDKEVKWSLKECRVFQNDRWVDQPLAEDEELDSTKLNDMKWALDDLKIVDVRRKPPGLTQNLRELGEVKLDAESVKSLAERGFYVARVGNRYELLSSEGDFTVLMKDGVQYVLRFGGIAAGTSASGEETGSSGSSGSGTNRYLFVMAEFNPEGIPKPELTPLPELPPEAAAGPVDASSGSAEGKSTPAEGNTQDGGNGSAQEETQAKQPAGEGQASQPEQPGEKPAGNRSPAEVTSQEGESPTSATAGETQQEKPQPEEGKKTEEGQTAGAKSIEEIKKERERIEAENKRKLEEYEEKIKKGKERVQQLNERFAEWYYVISDEVYRKIRLSRSDIVRKKSGSTGSSAETSGESQKSQEQPPSEASTESAQEAEKAGEGASMSGVKTEEQAGEVQSGQGTSPAPPGN